MREDGAGRERGVRRGTEVKEERGVSKERGSWGEAEVRKQNVSFRSGALPSEGKRTRVWPRGCVAKKGGQQRFLERKRTRCCELRL